MIQKFVETSRGKIAYFEGGEGETLLFLHGAFAMPEAYLPLLELLSNTYHVIAPTHPGHGQSFVISRIWKYGDFLKSYQEIIQVLKLNPKIIIGHSFGGALAISLSAELPNAKTILLDPAGLPFDIETKDFFRALIAEGEEAVITRPRLETVKTLTEAARVLLINITKHPENIPWFYLFGPQLDLSGECLKIHHPIGLIYGMDDKIVPKSVIDGMIKLIPQLVYEELPGKQHNYSVTEPEETYKLIITLIEKISIKST